MKKRKKKKGGFFSKIKAAIDRKTEKRLQPESELKEGLIKKGGINQQPTTSRPANPPKGQDPAKKEKQLQTTVKPMALSRPSAMPKSLAEIERIINAISNSDFIPKDMRGKPGNLIAAIQFGREIGLAPMQAIQNIAVINGRPCVWGDAMLGLVMASGQLEYIKETSVPGVSGTCIVKRKGRDPISRTFTMAQAKHAGLLSKGGPWQNYPERMLQMRPRSWALRDAFADILKGLCGREEAIDCIETAMAEKPVDALTPPKRIGDPEPAQTEQPSASKPAEPVEAELVPSGEPDPFKFGEPTMPAPAPETKKLNPTLEPPPKKEPAKPKPKKAEPKFVGEETFTDNIETVIPVPIEGGTTAYKIKTIEGVIVWTKDIRLADTAEKAIKSKHNTTIKYGKLESGQNVIIDLR